MPTSPPCGDENEIRVSAVAQATRPRPRRRCSEAPSLLSVKAASLEGRVARRRVEYRTEQNQRGHSLEACGVQNRTEPEGALARSVWCTEPNRTRGDTRSRRVVHRTEQNQRGHSLEACGAQNRTEPEGTSAPDLACPYGFFFEGIFGTDFENRDRFSSASRDPPSVECPQRERGVIMAENVYLFVPNLIG